MLMESDKQEVTNVRSFDEMHKLQGIGDRPDEESGPNTLVKF